MTGRMNARIAGSRFLIEIAVWLTATVLNDRTPRKRIRAKPTAIARNTTGAPVRSQAR